MIKPQETIFESGNEMAALAASQISYHIMVLSDNTFYPDC